MNEPTCSTHDLIPLTEPSKPQKSLLYIIIICDPMETEVLFPSLSSWSANLSCETSVGSVGVRASAPPEVISARQWVFYNTVQRWEAEGTNSCIKWMGPSWLDLGFNQLPNRHMALSLSFSLFHSLSLQTRPPHPHWEVFLSGSVAAWCLP